jgi:hypothetical protein
MYTPTDLLGEAQSYLVKTIHHKNIIGWNEFLHGCISNRWSMIHYKTRNATNDKRISPWEIKITQITLDLHRAIWEDRNIYIHGKTIEESRERARIAINKHLKEVYENPPRLSTQYKQVTDMPLEIHLHQSPTKLKDWLVRLDHQIRMTSLLDTTLMPGQLTIQQAIQNMERHRTCTNKYLP